MNTSEHPIIVMKNTSEHPIIVMNTSEHPKTSMTWILLGLRIN